MRIWRAWEGVKAIADDILVWGDGDTREEAIADHDKRLISLLERCQQKNIRLNRSVTMINPPSPISWWSRDNARSAFEGLGVYGKSSFCSLFSG